MIFYISEKGRDCNDGLTPSMPWRHHPKDDKATSISQGITLKIEDKVIGCNNKKTR